MANRFSVKGLRAALKNVLDGEVEDGSALELARAQAGPAAGDAAHVRGVVPWSLRVAAAWAWRITLIALVMYGFSYIASELAVIVIPVLVALLLAVLLEPLMRVLMRYLRFPRTLAAAVSLLAGIALVFGLMGLASSQIIRNTGQLVDKAGAGVETAVRWMVEGPLKLDADTVYRTWRQVQAQVVTFVEENTNALATSAFSTLSQIASFLTGFLMCLFCLFFFLKDGRKMWQWVLRLLPVAARHPLNEAAIRGWVTLGGYARTQALVAAIDAAGIGLGAFLLGVPLAIPIAVLVFFASFVPIVGAIITGVVAVAVALVTNGGVTALAMLAVIVAVQQIESNILYPFLMSSAASLHPVAVLLVVAAGGYVAGIVGAVFAVPTLAFVNTTVLYLRGYDKFLRLNYDPDRPGGPPGCLEEEIACSCRPSEANLKAAKKMRAKALAAGFDPTGEAAHRQAHAEAEKVREDLGEFDEANGDAGLPQPASDPTCGRDDTAQGAARTGEGEGER